MLEKKHQTYFKIIDRYDNQSSLLKNNMIMKTKKILFSMILILTTYCFCYGQNITPELKKVLDRADAAKEIAKQSNAKEDWQDVITEYKKAIDIDPTYSLVYYNLGYAYEVTEDYENAIKYYNLYLKLDPNSSIAEQLQTNINKLEYKRDKEKIQITQTANIHGLWKSSLIDSKSGRPFWIFSIDQFEKDIRVTVSPKSYKYKASFTYPTAIVLKEKSNLHFMFTTDNMINPASDLNKAANVFYTLDGLSSAGSSLNAGAVGSILNIATSFSKSAKTNSLYLFSLNIADSNRLVGNYNVKEYVTPAGESTKTTKDSIKSANFSKMEQSELDAIKIKYKSKRSGVGALFLSAACPGLGQIAINKQYVKGTLMMITLATSIVLVSNGKILPGMPILVCLWWYAVIDAPVCAHLINKKFGFACNNIYENQNLCLKLKPNISPILYTSKTAFATGLGLAMSFK